MRRTATLLAAIGLLLSLAGETSAQVAVTRGPRGTMRTIGGPAEPDSFTIGNAGAAPVTVTLTPSGGFFSLSATSVTLQPRSTQTIMITPTATAGGLYTGSVSITEPGAQRILAVPVRLFIGSQPEGSVAPALGSNLIFTQGLAGQPHLGQLSVSNFGTARMTGMLTGDVPWIEAPGGTVGIGSRETGRVDFTVNPAQRPDSLNPLGALVGRMSMVWLRGTSGEITATQVQSTSATVVDITLASIVNQAAAALAPGQIATFLAGISDISAISHVLISNRASTPAPGTQLFYSAAGTSPASSLLASIGQMPGLGSAWFPFAPQRLFPPRSSETGSVQLRTPQPSQVELAGFVEVIPDSQNVYVTALPVLSSAASGRPGETLVFSGVERSASATTDLHVQETSGTATTYTIEFFDQGGGAVGTTRNESLTPFGYAVFTNLVPEGARSVRITNTGAGAASLAGYAAVVNLTTRDRWTITDSRRTGSASEVFIPLLHPHPAEVWITNTSASAISVTTRIGNEGGGRRRAVRQGGTGSRDFTVAEATFTLGPRESRLETVAPPNLSLLRVIGPAGAFTASGRIRSSAPPRPGEFGTGIPALPAGAAIGTAGSKQFTLADDQPGVAIPSLLLLEASGRPVTARVTVHFSFAGGSTLATGTSTATADYAVPGGRVFPVRDLLRAVLGPGRDGLGRLFKIVIDVQPVAGEGRLLVYLQKDEQSGDITIYAD